MRERLFLSLICLCWMKSLSAGNVPEIQMGPLWTKEGPSAFQVNDPGGEWTGMYWNMKLNLVHIIKFSARLKAWKTSCRH